MLSPGLAAIRSELSCSVLVASFKYKSGRLGTDMTSLSLEDIQNI